MGVPVRSTLLPAALALLAAAPAPAARDRAGPTVDRLPGPVQPDAGTRVSASADGRFAAFAASWREIGGGAYAPSATPTVFLWDRSAGTLRQITASGPSDQPSVASATFRWDRAPQPDEFRTRTIVAFRSTANLAGANADASAEVFAWDSWTNQFTQVTAATAGASSDPAVGATFRMEEDANGRPTGTVLARWRVAFLSTADLAGDNARGGAEVFHYDRDAAALDRLVQVSHAPAGDALPPAVDARGRRVLFVHAGDAVPGDPGPGGGGTSVVSWDRRRGAVRLSPDGPGDDAEPALDRTGRRAAWSSTRDPAGGEPVPRAAWIARARGADAAPLAAGAGCAATRAPDPGAGRRALVAALTTAPAAGGACAAVPERAVVLRRGAVVEAAAPGPSAAWGVPRLLREGRVLVPSDADLDGSNGERGTVLWVLRP
jgi:hypothetical protein